MTKELQQRTNRAETFSNDLAHEIRNPLASLKSASELLDKTTQKNEGEKLFKIIEKKPRAPSSIELSKNLSSRSAKLRYAIKKKDFFDFETDVLKKFNNLIEIENIGDKIWKNY